VRFLLLVVTDSFHWDLVSSSFYFSAARRLLNETLDFLDIPDSIPIKIILNIRNLLTVRINTMCLWIFFSLLLNMLFFHFFLCYFVPFICNILFPVTIFFYLIDSIFNDCQCLSDFVIFHILFIIKVICKFY